MELKDFLNIAFTKLKEQAFIVMLLLFGIWFIRQDGMTRIAALEQDVRDCKKESKETSDKYEQLLEGKVAFEKAKNQVLTSQLMKRDSL